LIEHLVIEKNDKNDYLELINTTVNRWVADAGDPVNPSFVDLVVRNSKLWGLWIWFCPGTDVELSNIEPGIYPNWRMSDVWGLDGVGYDIELLDTTVEMFKLQILGNARIENVSGVQVATRGSSFAHVKNSIIQFNLILRGDEQVILEDTEVRDGLVQLIEDRSDLQYSIGRGGTHYLEFRRAVINAPFEIASDYTEIKGEVTILAGLQDVNWVFGIIDREFPIIVVDSDGHPIGDVQVEMVSPEGDVAWTGLTDDKGEIYPLIRFRKENYDKEWELKATADDLYASQRMGFLTNTPIMVSLRSIREEAKRAINHAGAMIKWVRNLGKMRNLEEAKRLLEEANQEYAKGNFQEALELANEVIELIEFKIDGESSEWEGIRPLATDPEGDAASGYGDLKSIYAATDDDYLYLMAGFYGEESDPQMLAVDIDTDFDGRDDYVIRGKYEFKLINQMPPKQSYDIEWCYDKVIELKFPLDLMGNPIEFQIRIDTRLEADDSIEFIDTIEPLWIKVSTLIWHVYLPVIIKEFPSN